MTTFPSFQERRKNLVDASFYKAKILVIQQKNDAHLRLRVCKSNKSAKNGDKVQLTNLLERSLRDKTVGHKCMTVRFLGTNRTD